jgi:ATP-dependent RNA helicase DDX5/DBP2
VRRYRDKHEIALHSKEFGRDSLPNPIFHFDEVEFPKGVLRKFERLGFKDPTPIQGQGWPIALKGNDMIGIAKTGSGKTLAFLMPAFRHIKAQADLRVRPAQSLNNFSVATAQSASC